MNNWLLPYIGKWGLFLVALCLLAVFPTFLLESEISVCLIKSSLGIECPGCGLTRAISAVFHGEIVEAIQYNHAIIVVFPLLVFVCIKTLINDYSQIKIKATTLRNPLSADKKR